jgi:recombination protein RecA
MHKSRPGEVVTLDDDTVDRSVPIIPTGAIELDVALGTGGVPRGRIIELYGPEMSGKTSLALTIAANCQRMGGFVGFIDAEHALTAGHAEDMGVIPRRMVTYQPNYGEQGVQMVEDMVKSEGFDIIIVDSVAALVPKAEIDGEIEDQHMALQARLMSRFMARANGICSESGTMLILVNQLREKLGSYGNPEITPGGRAIKFYASVRLDVRSAAGDRITEGKEIVGQTCKVTVKKNKLAAPFKQAKYDLYFGKGIDPASGLRDAGQAAGVISRTGNTYTDLLGGVVIGIGKEKCDAVLREDEALRNSLREGIYAVLRGEPPAILGSGDATALGGGGDDPDAGAE